DPLVEAGEGVEQGGLAGVGVANQGGGQAARPGLGRREVVQGGARRAGGHERSFSQDTGPVRRERAGSGRQRGDGGCHWLLARSARPGRGPDPEPCLATKEWPPTKTLTPNPSPGGERGEKPASDHERRVGVLVTPRGAAAA